jgi:hypothetical protein
MINLSQLSSFIITGLMLFAPSAMAEAELNCSDIQSAIDALPAEGGRVHLSGGEYFCDFPIVINKDNILLSGEGPSITLISARPGLAMPVILIGEPYADESGLPLRETVGVTVENLAVNGNMDKHADAAHNECYEYTLKKSVDCHYARNLVRNNGITVRRARGARIYNVLTYAAVSGGIVTEKVTNDLLIDGFESFKNFYDGFAGYQTQGSVIRNINIHDNYFSGISVDLGFIGNTFDGGMVYNNIDNGVFSANVGSNTYLNLNLFENKNHGFYIDGTRHKGEDGTPILIPGTCDNNVINDTKISGGRDGVYINHICQNIMLSRDLIVNADLNCVFEFPGSTVFQSEVQCLSSLAQRNLTATRF